MSQSQLASLKVGGAVVGGDVVGGDVVGGSVVGGGAVGGLAVGLAVGLGVGLGVGARVAGQQVAGQICCVRSSSHLSAISGQKLNISVPQRLVRGAAVGEFVGATYSYG